MSSILQRPHHKTGWQGWSCGGKVHGPLWSWSSLPTSRYLLLLPSALNPMPYYQQTVSSTTSFPTPFSLPPLSTSLSAFHVPLPSTIFPKSTSPTTLALPSSLLVTAPWNGSHNTLTVSLPSNWPPSFHTSMTLTMLLVSWILSPSLWTPLNFTQYQ